MRWVARSVLVQLRYGGHFAAIEMLKELVLSEDWLTDLDCSTDVIQYSARRFCDSTRLAAVNPKPDAIEAELRFTRNPMCLVPMFNTPESVLKKYVVRLSFAPHEVKFFEIGIGDGS